MAQLLIILIIFIILAIILFKIFKKVFKTLLVLFVLIVLFFIITGFLLYSDINDFKENFPVSQNLYLVEDNESLLTGITLKQEGQEIQLLTDQNLYDYNDKYKNKELKKLMDDNYKIIFMSLEFLENNLMEEIKLEAMLRGQESSITKEQLILLLRSENPIETYFNILGIPEENWEPAREELRTSGINDNTQAKAALFLEGFKSLNQDGLIERIFEDFKEDEIKIYPETITFKTAKLMPMFIVKKISEAQTQFI